MKHDRIEKIVQDSVQNGYVDDADVVYVAVETADFEDAGLEIGADTDDIAYRDWNRGNWDNNGRLNSAIRNVGAKTSSQEKALYLTCSIRSRRRRLRWSKESAKRHAN